MPGMKYLEIDVNFSLGFSPGMDESIVRTFLEKTQPLIFDAISTLNDVDFLLHLCAHLYKEATVMSWVEMGRDISCLLYTSHSWSCWISRMMVWRLASIPLAFRCSVISNIVTVCKSSVFFKRY